MPDFTLLNGKEITFDLTKLSHKQWKGLIRPTRATKTEPASEAEDVVIARVIGVEISELEALTEREYRALADAFVRRVTRPIEADPNA